MADNECDFAYVLGISPECELGAINEFWSALMPLNPCVPL